MKKKMFLVSFLSLLIIKCFAVRQDTIYINNVKHTVNYSEEKYFFSKSDLAIEDVIKQKFKEKKEMDFSYITGWVWLKLIIRNKSEFENFILNASDGHVSGFYMYKPTSSGYVMTPPKLHHPEDGREIHNRLPCFNINLLKGETKTFYIKINSNNEVINFDYIIRNETNFTEFVQMDYMIIGLYFGALLIIILVNIFYYFSLKDPIFISYALFVFGNFLFTATLDGFTWLWGPNSTFSYHACFFCFRTWEDSLVFFIMQLVNLKHYNKMLNKIGFTFILYHSGLLVIVDCFDISKFFMHQLEAINWMFSIILVLIIIAKSHKNNRYLFKYYIFAFIAILCSFLFFLYYHIGNAKNYLVFEHGMKAGTLIEIITLSFAVSRRFRLTENDLKSKKEEEQQLTEQVKQLEMNVRKAQMNPHFMFNALTSIEYFIMKNNSDQARGYLEKFAQLMRLTLDNSRTNYIPLKDDLSALELYIELEFLRLKAYSHQYEINVSNEVNLDAIHVPALLIQPFVENAIWHGLQKKEEAGKLVIKISLIGTELLCIIEDDGGGMEKKKNPVKRKSSGILITKERLILIHAILNTRNEFHIEDITDESGNPTGIRVQFNMPYVSE